MAAQAFAKNVTKKAEFHLTKCLKLLILNYRKPRLSGNRAQGSVPPLNAVEKAGDFHTSLTKFWRPPG